MDLDEDGKLDILSGSYSERAARSGLFQVFWGGSDGFKKCEPLKGTDGKNLVVPAPEKGPEWQRRICTRPTAVDWDGDKDLDLVVGNFEGSFYLFRGEGKGKFQPKPERIQAAGADLLIKGKHSDPFLVDWDGDGDFDLLSGSSQGGVQWSENTAGPGKEPALEPFRELLVSEAPEWGTSQPADDDGKIVPADSTRVYAEDVNGDGKLDLLVGDRTTIASADTGGTRTGFVWLYIQK